MAAMSSWLEEAILNQVLRGITYSGANTIYAALFVTPTDDGGGTEVSTSGTGYSRIKVDSFSVPVNGFSSNATQISFGPAATEWGNITHFALYDGTSPTAKRLFHGNLTVPKIINIGDTFVFPVGNITIGVS